MDNAIPSTDTVRRAAMFPVLSEADIARVARFGSVKRYMRGALLFTAGPPCPGIFVILMGVVSVTQRSIARRAMLRSSS
jgi:thioredoxin reductase (NADPH)